MIKPLFPAALALRTNRALLWALIFVLAPYAQAAAKAGTPPAAPQIAARNYILLDVTCGKVLAAKKADERCPPASLTKLMTAYVVTSALAAGSIRGDERVTVSERASRMGGTSMFLTKGEQVSVANLLKGAIIVSGNDASVALAEHMAGSEPAFADLMNASARQLGMTNSHFRNASGWPADNHYSTARDLAVVSRHLIEDYPDYYATYAEKAFQYGIDKRTGKPRKPQANRNTLLWSGTGVDGLKTGYTEKAGYCLAASAR